jgi:hypothetical protein
MSRLCDCGRGSPPWHAISAEICLKGKNGKFGRFGLILAKNNISINKPE